ncbi:MAG: hypothetical protein HY658_03365, partial [Actinobacteria bacterium]|nr:hypothetical protein [Actinomycetota bacterium]
MARPGRARRPGIAAALTVAVISSIAPSSRAGSAGEPGPGSMVWVGEVGAVAPAPGTTVWVEALGAAGSSPVVGIETLAHGTVVIHRPGTGSGAEAAAGGGLLAPCS